MSQASPHPTASDPGAHRGFITLAIMLATIMQTLDSTIANVALPHMAGNLSASQDQISWVLTSYIVAAAIATPLTGWLTGRFGRKRVFLVAVVGFTVASMLCGMSESLAQIVLARLLQGLFGAALVPLSQAVMLDSNPPEKHAQAMAVWGMGVMIGPILGPTLGGWLTDNLTWRWVFFINLPVGMLSFYGIKAYIRETETDRKLGFDFYGFLTLSLAIGLFQMLLDRGEQLDWFSSTEIVLEAVGALVSLTFFVVLTATAQGASFFNVNLLKDRNFVTGLGFYFLVGLLLYATRALLPPLLQTLMGYPVVTTGLVTGPSGIGTMLAMLLAGRLTSKVDPRALIALGFSLTALSLWQMSGYTLDMSEGGIVWPGFIQGMGVGFVSVPLTTVTFSTLERRYRSDGTSIFSLFRNIGSSIGISLMQTLLTRNSAIYHARLAELVTSASPAIRAGLPALLDPASPAGLAALNNEVTRQASFLAYLTDFRIMMVATLLALPFLLLMRKNGNAPPAEIDAQVLE
ncbi:DHA2 family efflux MFS transporter permease subunit [Pseudogulbenkiania ferrooxidans]|uniref:Drug resistance transporter, EmrB/QacA subfamily n=1 Tax=Pseudogulbenkiania ferrooxidans 2002 TaxID=279714 RepID=B9Z0I1_9NEIS|nr:DHA2 family efflux MFS transporter permease subunit [Pseudogulbenkiania ferrooxidans]EEG09587.1 drug resistance transporter, EmrB/QacA subfamily [Pseudogulbenkiania ferrooxidans 2002]